MRTASLTQPRSEYPRRWCAAVNVATEVAEILGRGYIVEDAGGWAPGALWNTTAIPFKRVLFHHKPEMGSEAPDPSLRSRSTSVACPQPSGTFKVGRTMQVPLSVLPSLDGRGRV